MQGEHIIAYGKITEREGNESGRWIDLETQGREEATEGKQEKVWGMREWDR